MNLYTVLGIARDADEETIRSAYKILARRYHPDRGAGSSAEKFRQVNEAYETLIDPGSRHTYDRSLQCRQTQVSVRIEPIRAPGSFPQEDAGLFGRFSSPPQTMFPNSPNLHELFVRRLNLLDDLFFDSDW